MDGNSASAVRESDIRVVVSVVAAILKIMVAHFVCILFTGFMIYTALPGSSTLVHKKAVLSQR